MLDGTARSPGQPWKYGNQQINTLWGELACSLAVKKVILLLKNRMLTELLPGRIYSKRYWKRNSPCVLLIDESVAYIRQFPNGQSLSGGSDDSNMSFIQALTEAIKLVPTAIMLASLPESEVEAGSNRGIAALQALEKTFGRIQALWKPVATEEAFEIVRRRLFEPVRDAHTRDAVCRAFADAYISEGVKMPSETQESRYFDRLVKAYPIHPESSIAFMRIWTTIQNFQRTRGVLKLMAKAIYRLWKDQNQDLMILPGSLPLYDGGTRNDLLYYLAPGWDAVLEKISTVSEPDYRAGKKEPRFGAINAARRVARAIFFGSAPAASGIKKGIRGLDRARVLLGCFQPGQSSSTFSDALNRLADRLHYLNSSGDKAQDTTRFWFDTCANLRREMEDRKGRFDENEVRSRVADALRKISATPSFFEGIHPFTPHADVPDDGSLRLVFLSLEESIETGNSLSN